ncbi:PEP-CTERM sorting domain-containing protein [Edaphobacter sp. HDX4]|uniref:PEP-CTERM sorting domain-containing protein n=1 Tax=Edaphobacter sp. HDX4 TaxID=2794064 RepID=UPI002FE5EC24
MPRITFALVLVLVFASAATGVPVHASTECERWVTEYRDQLAHSDLMKRANAARHRLHHYVHRQIATLNHSKPHPRARVLPARLQRPKMTREEMLRELEFACGELPVDPVELNQPIAFVPAPDLLTGLAPEDDSTSGPLMPQNGPQGLLASSNNPGGGWFPGTGGGGGGWGGGGGGGYNPPTGGNGGNNPGPPTLPPGPPTAVTPEPGSLLLVATGIIGVAGALRRRLRLEV